MQNDKIKTGLVWFKNDLRAQDNATLAHACKENNRVIAVYFLDPKQFQKDKFGFKKTERFRAQFLLQTLTDLKKSLNDLNISLLIYQCSPQAKISSLIETYDIDAIYYQKEWTQEERDCITEVKHSVSNKIAFHSYYDQFLFHPEDIPVQIEDVPKVFTNFRKQLEKNASVRHCVITNVQSESNRIEHNLIIPNLAELGFTNFDIHSNSAFPFKGGETEALFRLNDYFFNTKKIGFYKKTRNGLIGKDYSSKFSPWLANGSISARTIYWHLKQFEEDHFKNQSTYWLIFELIWRDFFKYISLKHNNAIFKQDGILKRIYNWSKNTDLVNSWINGTTDQPFVNANMIELKKTGWMSNRGRQNVASYFAKELELDWRIGAAYFESLLIDYDVHSNYGNWMYVAGVGNDPRDRKFNIKAQAERYDASGAFQKLWLQNTLF